MLACLHLCMCVWGGRVVHVHVHVIRVCVCVCAIVHVHVDHVHVCKGCATGADVGLWKWGGEHKAIEAAKQPRIFSA